jgi:hypothetical protein
MGLKPGECPAGIDDRTIDLVRLDGHLAEACRGIEARLQNGPELRPERVLAIIEIICRRAHEIGISAAFHDQERLSLPSHSLKDQPARRIFQLRRCPVSMRPVHLEQFLLVRSKSNWEDNSFIPCHSRLPLISGSCQTRSDEILTGSVRPLYGYNIP